VIQRHGVPSEARIHKSKYDKYMQTISMHLLPVFEDGSSEIGCIGSDQSLAQFAAAELVFARCSAIKQHESS
jgi:hypothetical protein